jgi:hypothetical protein
VGQRQQQQKLLGVAKSVEYDYLFVATRESSNSSATLQNLVPVIVVVQLQKKTSADLILIPGTQTYEC